MSNKEKLNSLRLIVSTKKKNRKKFNNRVFVARIYNFLLQNLRIEIILYIISTIIYFIDEQQQNNCTRIKCRKQPFHAQVLFMHI